VASVFEVLAEPHRRAILRSLVSNPRSVQEMELALGLPQPTVSKHLRVLRDAGFVEARVDARRRLYRLRAEPFRELEAWLVPFRDLWSTHLDLLEAHLATMDDTPPGVPAPGGPHGST